MADESKKKIAFIIGSMRRGGAERVISILANYYAHKEWAVDVITLLDDRNEYELNNQVNVVHLCGKSNSRLKQLPMWLFRIRKYVVNEKPDRIVSFIARINIITIFSCLGLKKHIVISERNDPKADGRSVFLRTAAYLFYPLADTVVFQTKWAQSCFCKKIKNKSVIIPNPVQVTKESLCVKEKKIAAVGRLLEQKNHSMLINAFKKVHDDYPEYKLFIYGEGRLRNQLLKQIQALKLDEAVFLPGNVSNIHEKISDAEMFVLSSNYEGMSNALLEAMMMGLPCISTDCAGSNEIIVDNVNGLLTPIGCADKLSECMIRLINDKELSALISKESKISAKAFDTEELIKKWESIIEK